MALGYLKDSPFAEDVEDVLLYGSCARGDFSYSSDVDIAVVFKPSRGVPSNTIREARAYLEFMGDGIATVDAHFIRHSTLFETPDTFCKQIRKGGISIWN